MQQDNPRQNIKHLWEVMKSEVRKSNAQNHGELEKIILEGIIP